MIRRVSSLHPARVAAAPTMARARAEARAKLRRCGALVSGLLALNTAQWPFLPKSVRGRGIAPILRTNFGDHETLRTISIAHQHELAGAQFGDAEAAQRFHVNENVG